MWKIPNIDMKDYKLGEKSKDPKFGQQNSKCHGQRF